MGSRVVLVGSLKPSLGLSGEIDGLAVADIRHPDAVETTIHDVLDAGDYPVVTCMLDDAGQVRDLLACATVRFPGLLTALEPLPGSPLAVGIASSLADDLNGPDHDVDPWRLATLDTFRQTAWSAVWLPSVSGLRTPPPSLAQHVRSWLPGSGYLARLTPDPQVVAARKRPLSGLGLDARASLMHTPTSGASWVVPAVAESAQSVSTTEISAFREQIDSYGTSSAIEMLALPEDFHPMSMPRAEVVGTCRGCGARHARDACPFCKMYIGHPIPRVAQGATT